MIKIFSFILLAVSLANCDYNELKWTDCGSDGVALDHLDLTPMPIVQPGNAKLKLGLLLKRPLSGPLKVTLDIKRTVNKLALELRCYLANGIYIGSCTYDDFCKVIETLLPQFNKKDCSPKLLTYGVDCTCPFNIKPSQIEIDEDIELPDASVTIATWLASGDFDVKIKTEDDKGVFACLDLKFSVKPNRA